MLNVTLIRCMATSKHSSLLLKHATKGLGDGKTTSLWAPLHTAAIRTSAGSNALTAHLTAPLLRVCASREAVRGYAKGRDKGGKGRKNKSVIDVSEDDMADVINYSRFKRDMEAVMTQYRDDLLRASSVRTSVASLESLEVELEGDKYPLNEIAQVLRKSPQMLVINCGAFPTATKAVLEAVRDAGMNLNPSQEGTSVAVPVPKVSKEHREGLVSKIKAIRNKCKDDLRKVQNNFQKKAKDKETEFSMDLIQKVVAKIKEINDDYVKEVDTMLEAKNKELLQAK